MGTMHFIGSVYDELADAHTPYHDRAVMGIYWPHVVGRGRGVVMAHAYQRAGGRLWSLIAALGLAIGLVTTARHISATTAVQDVPGSP